jgi:hypothetical protein
MPRIPIRFKPKLGPGQDADKVTRHSVRGELDGASLGGERSCDVGGEVDFGQPQVSEGKHVLKFYIVNLDSAGNAAREHVQEYPFDAKDTTAPGEAIDGEVLIGDPLPDDTAPTGPGSSVQGDQVSAPVSGAAPAGPAPATGAQPEAGAAGTEAGAPDNIGATSTQVPPQTGV